MDDFTEIAAWAGTVYAAFVIDCNSPMIVGWRMTNHMRTDLLLDALEMAVHQRGVHKGHTIHHPDHVGDACRRRCRLCHRRRHQYSEPRRCKGVRMPDSGTDLGADLDRLEAMAKVNLPNVADQYSASASDVEAASQSVGMVFARPAGFGDTQGPALGPWIQLKDTIHTFLKCTADNLDATAEALLLAVKAIADTDAEASKELDRLRTQAGRI
jgi:hypothetical protein